MAAIRYPRLNDAAGNAGLKHDGFNGGLGNDGLTKVGLRKEGLRKEGLRKEGLRKEGLRNDGSWVAAPWSGRRRWFAVQVVPQLFRRRPSSYDTGP
jgi:hypothetical protein